MIISLKKKFIFVANLKTASTSIEKALKPWSEIVVDVTTYGKHLPLPEIEGRFSWIFDTIKRDEFFRFAVIRDPADYFVSLYNSHQKESFQHNPKLYTGEMSFREFWEDWCTRVKNQVLPQHQRLLDADGKLGVDYIIDFEQLENQILDIHDILNLGGVLTLSHVNSSPEGFTKEDIDPDIWVEIYTKFGGDRALLEGFSGRQLSAEEKAAATAYLHMPAEGLVIPEQPEKLEEGGEEDDLSETTEHEATELPSAKGWRRWLAAR